MRVLPRSAASRIALLSAAGFALSVIIIGFVVLFAAEDAFRRQMDDSIELTTTSLVGEFVEDGFVGLVDDIEVRESGPAGGLGFAVFAPDGQQISGALETAMPAVGWSELHFSGPGSKQSWARALTSQLSDGKRLVVAADIAPIEQMTGMILRLFALGIAGVAAVSVGFAMLLRRYLKRRLDAIGKGAQAFASGDLAGRADIGPRDDEFDRLAGSINAMLDRIEALLRNLRQVTSDLAHDMRTPLTGLRGQLLRLRDAHDAEAGGSQLALAEAAIGKCDDILQLFSAILRISELDGGQLQRHFRPVDLAGLAAEIHEAHEPLAEEAGGRLLLDIGKDPIMVLGDRELLAHAVINLVQNALLHTPAGSMISISARHVDGAAEISVTDNGPGIARADRDRATERFVRLDAARSTPGHGLGLSMVKAIAEAHAGRLVLEDAGPGLRAVIVFR